MAAFCAAVVRAPRTGMILVTEMTANFTLLLPLLATCFAALVVPTLLRHAPIYGTLWPRASTRKGVQDLWQQEDGLMSAMAVGGSVFACLFGGALLGLLLRAVLPAHHLSAESKD